MLDTSSKALTMISRNLATTSFSVQKYFCTSWTHSKYETVTPPALARISGTTRMPLSRSMSSASRVVGLLAPSMINLAFTSSALSL